MNDLILNKSESKLSLFLSICHDSECKIMSMYQTNGELNAYGILNKSHNVPTISWGWAKSSI